MALAAILGPDVCVGCRRPAGALCRSCGIALQPCGRLDVAGLDAAAAAWLHEGAARELVLGLKLRGRRSFAAPLVEGIVALVQRVGTEATAVTWPPCTRAARWRRGFDHAEVLARGVALGLGLPTEPLLRRVADTADQADLSGAERRKNLVGAFAARSSPEAVLLVDDVVTTGATLQACASALRAHGATRVEASVASSAFS